MSNQNESSIIETEYLLGKDLKGIEGETISVYPNPSDFIENLKGLFNSKEPIKVKVSTGSEWIQRKYTIAISLTDYNTIKSYAENQSPTTDKYLIELLRYNAMTGDCEVSDRLRK